MLRPSITQNTLQLLNLPSTILVSTGSKRGKHQASSELTPLPALMRHGQELSTSDEAPLDGRRDGKAAFALHGNVIAAANHGSNDHFTHSHVTWDRDNATAQTEDPFLEAQPPRGFEFRSDFGQLANQESSVAGLQALSLHERSVIRPPPGLGFTPRSRPTQITRQPPPGLGFTPSYRRSEPSAQPRELTHIEKLRQCQCLCCPNGRHRPAPGSVPPQKDEPQRVQPKGRVQTMLESDFHKWIIAKSENSSTPDSPCSPSKPSTPTPEERRLARKVGREAMRREMNAEDDEAIEARL